ncbi:MAG: hypothetical protein LC808_14375, partial [Actinobacteria bacterium]|nr:hypothetical protein [Actinomycetota bacterium]
MPNCELVSWLCPISLMPPRPGLDSGSLRRADRSYGRNAKLLFVVTLPVDGAAAGLYVRQEHRRHGPRRA